MVGIWYLFAGFMAVILCSVQYESLKLQLESWITDHESLNQTLVYNINV